MVGVFDDRQVQIEQAVERENRLVEFPGRSDPGGKQGTDQLIADSRKGCIGLDLIEPQFGVPFSYLQASPHVLVVVAALE